MDMIIVIIFIVGVVGTVIFLIIKDYLDDLEKILSHFNYQEKSSLRLSAKELIEYFSCNPEAYAFIYHPPSIYGEVIRYFGDECFAQMDTDGKTVPSYRIESDSYFGFFYRVDTSTFLYKDRIPLGFKTRKDLIEFVDFIKKYKKDSAGEHFRKQYLELVQKDIDGLRKFTEEEMEKARQDYLRIKSKK